MSHSLIQKQWLLLSMSRYNGSIVLYGSHDNAISVVVMYKFLRYQPIDPIRDYFGDQVGFFAGYVIMQVVRRI